MTKQKSTKLQKFTGGACVNYENWPKKYAVHQANLWKFVEIIAQSLFVIIEGGAPMCQSYLDVNGMVSHSLDA